MEAIINTSQCMAGIKAMVQAESTVVVHYEPGNATRYVILFTRVEEHTGKLLGCSGGAWVMNVMNLQEVTPLVIPDSRGHLAPSYVMEKTGLREGDVGPVLDVIRDRLG